MISASIVLYQTCLDSVAGTINDFLESECSGHLFLVDNSPRESSSVIEAFVAEQRVTYIFLNKNVGYGAAHNIAMRKASELGYDYHAVLNPDVRFGTDVLKGLFQKMVSNVSVVHIMPRVCYPDGSTQYLCKQLPSPFNLLLRRFVPTSRWGHSLDYSYELRGYDYEKEWTDVPALSGCFMFLRLAAVKKIDYFDENIFMYMEDIDLTRRLLACGSNIYYPKFTVYHKFEKGSYKSGKLLQYHIRSAIYYFNKWGWFFDGFRSRSNLLFERKNREHQVK